MRCFHLHSCCSSPHLWVLIQLVHQRPSGWDFQASKKCQPDLPNKKHQKIFQSSNHSACDVIVRNSLQEFQNGANGVTMRSHKNGLSTLQCWSNSLLPKWHHSSLSFVPAETPWISESNEFLEILSFTFQVDHGIMDLNTELHPLQCGISNVSVKVFSWISDNGVFEALSLRDVCLAESSIPQGNINMRCYIGIHRNYTPTAQWYRCYVCKMLLSHFRSCQA